jgi:phage FluMu gp28-like protein
LGNAKVIPENSKAIFLPYQQRWIKDSSLLKLCEKARQIGVTWTTAYRAVECTGTEGNKHDQWATSRDELQAKLFIEDCKLFARVLNIAAKDLGMQVIDEKTRNTALVLELTTGKRIMSMSSNADAQAGKRGRRILDEFALHPDPRNLWAIAYPGITWGGNMEVISTHRGSHNFFNQLIREVRENGNPKKISLHRTTLQDALEQGFLFKLQQSLLPDHEAQAMDEAAYFDFIKNGCADNESFEQEYMCNPADDDSAFLDYDLIASCEYSECEQWEVDIEERKSKGSRFYAGLDIGRVKDLTVLWVLEVLGDVLYTRRVITLQNMSKPDQEKVLWPIMTHMERTCIDNTGLGIGWTDDAKAKFGMYRVEGVTFTTRTKEAMAYPLRSHMEERKIRIPYDPKIRADLRAITKETTAAGNIRFTAERSINGHADRFWAMALGIHAATTGNTGNLYTPIHIKNL